ncbi:serine/threonine dehydratase [Streptomyces sp. NPDC050856]|uniref:serine/threonine dehydratase n=1 Tax=Streptomyces sp. NPDC050856 TaxID=3154939 RepID=UPI00340EBBE9
MPPGIPAGTADVLDHRLVAQARERVEGLVRPVSLSPLGPGVPGEGQVYLALEFMQHTGSFKARGALNFALAHADAGAMPEAGVVIASGGNAGLACAWATTTRAGYPTTVFLPETAPRVKVERLRGYGARVCLVGDRYAQALDASRAYAAEHGALQSHAYDHPLIAAGAGTLLPEITAAVPGGVDTVVVAVGGGGLFSGVASAAAERGIRVVAVEPERCRALNAALDAGEPVDVPVDSVAADSLGATRASRMAVTAAQRPGVTSLLVSDEEIVRARHELWENHRIVVEHGAATALAALTSGRYATTAGERVAVVLCGANTDPATVV